MRFIDYPLRFDARGRTAETDESGYIRDLMEQVLFTAPGERVNRPTFGSAVMQLVFAPNGGELAAASQLLVQGALQQWLGDLIALESVLVEADESTLCVRIQYQLRHKQLRETVELTRQVAG